MFRTLLAILLAAAVVSCRQDQNASSSARAGARPGQTLGQFHWLGKSALSSNTNAAYLLSIWNLPEAANFERHAIDKLASIPLQLQTVQTNLSATNRAVATWRPFFQDLVYNETFFNVRHAKAETIEGGVALRLGPSRAPYWRTNLNAAFSRIPGAAIVSGKSNLWRIPTRWGVYHAQLEMLQGWTMLRFGPEANPAKYFTDLAQRQAPLKAQGTNPWLHVTADIATLAPSLGLSRIPTQLPILTLTSSSDGEYVRTTGKVGFEKPLKLTLEPWSVPTNLIGNPMLSFTAARGIRPFLSEMQGLQRMPPASLPNQGYLWSLQGGTILSFAAFPLKDAKSFVDRHGPELARRWNPWLTNHARGQIQYDSTNHSVSWKAVPIFAPGFQASTSNIGDVLLGKLALADPPPGGPPFPEPLLKVLERGSDVVYYQWEISEHRLANLFANLQAGRLALRRPTLPQQTAQVDFLKGIGTKLGNATTTIRLKSPTELSLERKSHSGLAALEWHLLVDWLASPTFPIGLHTTVAADAPQKPRTNEKPRTNSVPTAGKTNVPTKAKAVSSRK